MSLNSQSLIGLIVGGVLILVLAFLLLRPLKPPREQVMSPGLANLQPGAADTLTLTSWNLGYAGLGAQSDFIADGGQMSRVPGKAAARANRDAIADVLAATPSDVFLLQEAAGPSYLNRGVDLNASLRQVLGADHWLSFAPEFRSRWLPGFMWPAHGKMTASRIQPAGTRLQALPSDGALIAGLFRRTYQAPTLFLENSQGRDWAIINVHLAAFDAEGARRQIQLEALFDYAQRLEADGYHVIMGGDWNLRLTATDFPHTTEERHLFWLHDFPDNALPDGWAIVVDPAVATVRTAHAPYQKGENYAAIIDGFIVSPGVSAAFVATRDLDFQHSDHQPVTARFTVGAVSQP